MDGRDEATRAPDQAAPAAARPRRHGLHPGPDGGWEFMVWAPRCTQLALVVEQGSPLPLQAGEDGWWSASGLDLVEGARYQLALPDGRLLPEPASRHQPEGVHGPASAIDLAAFPWSDAGWRGQALSRYVIYELHLGTFTGAGTCDAAITRLDDLVDLGITAIEVMPVAQCPGTRNWGYDGVHPFAVQHSLGGPRAFQRLVDACHARGLAVILDVVYNHLGPEGDYLGEYMPITTARYHSPWGAAINVDGPDSDGVRDYLLANAEQWFRDFHVDALRLDAVHAIVDTSARPFLQQLAQRVEALAQDLGRSLHLIAESDLNAGRVIRGPEQGGLGMHSQWNDDFHHSLHALLTGEHHGYYAAFGAVDDLRRACARGFTYDGRWSPVQRMTRGDAVDDLPTERFVVCAQNHDQIGNRYGGERLSRLTDFEGLKCAAASVLLSPYLPLLFMGEEWGEQRPFWFFVDHSDPALVAAVRAGRDAEFATLNGSREPRDPFDPRTRDESRIDWDAAGREPGRTVRAFYRECLRLRRTLASLHPGPREHLSVGAPLADVIALERRRAGCRTLLLINATPRAQAAVPLPEGRWETLLASCAVTWRGPGWVDGARVGTLTLPAHAAVLLCPGGDRS